MLPTKFRVNWPFSSGEEVQKRFLRQLPWQFLAVKIRQNSKMKIHNIEFKILQNADDISIFLDGSSDALNCTIIKLDKFANVLGLKINFDKTQVV